MFTCEAEGFKVRYEWKRHNNSGSVERQSSFNITRATPPDEDQYYCIAMTGGGYVFSNNVTLSVDGEEFMQCVILFHLRMFNPVFPVDQINFTQHPEDVLVGEGDVLTLTIAAEGPGRDQFTYQWNKMGSNSLPNKASGGDTAQLVITSVTTSDSGSYYCIVTNQWGRMVESMRSIVKILGRYVLMSFVKKII